MLKQLNKLRPLFSRKDKFRYMGLLGLMGIGAILEVAGISAVPAFIATLAVPEKVRALPYAEQVLSALGIETATGLVVWGAIGLVIVFAIRASYMIFLQYAQIRMTEHHRVRMARLLFDAYMRAPYEFHLGRNTAELLRNVNNETTSIITGIINPILALTLNSMMTLGIVGVLIYATPWSGLVAVGIVGGGSWLFLRAVRSRMSKYGVEAREERKKAIQAVNQGLGGFLDARVLGVEETLVEEFHGSVARFARYNRFQQFIGKLSNPLLEFIAVGGLMLVVLSMVLSGMDLATMVPMLGLFGAAIVRLRSSVGTITATISGLSYNMASVDAVVDDLKLLKHDSFKADLDNSRDRRQLPFTDEIRVDNLTYSYPDAHTPSLSDISLSIKKGESVGFVGATGSGKTTMINVVLGLLEPQRGSITVDGTNIREELRAWQNNIGYIPQSIYLLDDTIRKNVAFGIPEERIDDEKVWTAIRAAQIDHHIEGLPDGLETYVGERGVRLSGGQRQRIGLARALYNNPDVLIMDEATSALDNETESLVMQALDALKGDRTLIMIAHRLSTVMECDRLYFLKNGRIDARGTYDELRSAHGEFRKMANVE
ncbi:MAG: ABC transporter ATP-binding protein [Rhodothermales bacterium]|nr:ABC transporter ATP-binding protein [Rhodothermales bacterium]